MHLHNLLRNLLLCALLVTLISCASTPADREYEVSRTTTETSVLDEPTPAGPVPPPQPYTTSARPYRPDTIMTGESAESILARRQEAARQAMRRAYGGDGPSVVLYLNRALSGQVSQWEGSVRIAQRTEEHTEKAGASESRQSGSTTEIQHRTGDAPRRMPEETWAWDVEQAILASLQDGGVAVKDSRMITRLTAADQSSEAGPAGTLDSSNVEIESLRQHADVLCEVLINWPRQGYQEPAVFHVKATNTKTGEVILTRQITPNLGGYQDGSLPDPIQTGTYVGTEILEGLASHAA